MFKKPGSITVNLGDRPILPFSINCPFDLLPLLVSAPSAKKWFVIVTELERYLGVRGQMRDDLNVGIIFPHFETRAGGI